MSEHVPSGDHLDRLPTDEELGRLQWTTVLYYLHETNPDNGLVRDKTDPYAPCSIAAVGLALATIPAVVERGVLIRKFAAKSARRRLRSRRDLSRTRPGTRDSSITSSTSIPAIASGIASSPRSTQRSSSRGRLPVPPTSTPTRRKRPTSDAWPTRSTAGPSGTGR